MKKIALIGHLGRDPETREAGRNTVVTLNLAVNDPREKDAPPTWFRVSVWGKSGEACSKHLSKGSRVYVDGDLSVREFDRKDGTRGYSLEVNARDVQFLGAKHAPREPRPDEGGYHHQTYSQAPQGQPQGYSASYGQPAPQHQPQDDLPF